MINTSTTVLEPTPRLSPARSPTLHHVTAPSHVTIPGHVTTSPRGFTVSSSSPFVPNPMLFSQSTCTSPGMNTLKPGSDKATQTTTSPGPLSPSDPAMFCTVLCNMLLDRIKDTLQEAMKTYANDADREDKVRGLVNEALTSAGSDLDKKLSIVSVQSLMQRPTVSNASRLAPSSLPPQPAMVPESHLHLGLPTLPKPSLYPPTAAPNSHVSDYINRLSFIYGPSRPSMFNPYVKNARHESEEKENVPERAKKEEEGRKEEEKNDTVRMEVDSEQSKVETGEEDINIVDDIEEDYEDSDNDLNKSFDDSIPGEAHTATSPSTSRSAPITPIPITMSPTAIQDKIQASLATNGFVDPAVQYELQKLLLSAAIAQGSVPTFSPPLISTKDCDPRSDIPVMIPSNGAFFDKREYNCQHCDATFSYGSKLRAHMICVHSIKSYQCRQCRKSFLDKEEYVKHLDLHPQRKFQCDKCPSSFDKQHQLSLHYRSHTNEKPYRCQICQRQFAVNDALIRHMRIHTGERPYACNVCGKRFAQKSGLTYHSYLHTGNRPYKCTTCGQGFVHRQALKQHLMKNHLNEQVGRILNSTAAPSGYSPSQSSSGLSWDKDSVMTAEATMKRAFPWENKEQGAQAPFKLEGMAS